MNKVYKLVILSLIGLFFEACKAESVVIPPTPVEYSNSIHWGVNIHRGGDDPQNMANVLSERNLKDYICNTKGSI